jgi:hypothetical protein
VLLDEEDPVGYVSGSMPLDQGLKPGTSTIRGGFCQFYKSGNFYIKEIQKNIYTRAVSDLSLNPPL